VLPESAAVVFKQDLAAGGTGGASKRRAADAKAWFMMAGRAAYEQFEAR
jgi:hypothetical protein